MASAMRTQSERGGRAPIGSAEAGRKRRQRTKRRLLLSLAGLLLASDCSTSDPPGDGFLFLSLDRLALRQGYTALDFQVKKVAVFYDDVPPDSSVACEKCQRRCQTDKQSAQCVTNTNSCP